MVRQLSECASPLALLAAGWHPAHLLPAVQVSGLAFALDSFNAILLAQPVELLLVGRGQGDEQVLAIHRR